MKHSTGRPTKAEQARFQALKEMGCICCWNYLGIKVAAEIHHLVDKGTRKHSGGHEATLPLCEYHHRGVPFKGCSKDEMEHHYGPSLALRKRAFIEQFGTERQLLETVNAMLERGGRDADDCGAAAGGVAVSKVFCNDCRHCFWDNTQWGCRSNPDLVATPLQMERRYAACVYKNRRNDCAEFEARLTEKPHWLKPMGPKSPWRFWR